MKRPTRHSPEVIKAVAEKLYGRVSRWDNEASIEELEEALTDSFEWDGYVLANRLDDWDPDAQLVSILDDATHLAHDSVGLLEIEYAKQLTPRFKVGDIVALPRRTGVVGEIVHLSNTGYYHVFSEGLGHVRQGVGTHAIHVPWEQIDEANPVDI